MSLLMWPIWICIPESWRTSWCCSKKLTGNKHDHLTVTGTGRSRKSSTRLQTPTSKPSLHSRARWWIWRRSWPSAPVIDTTNVGGTGTAGPSLSTLKGLRFPWVAPENAMCSTTRGPVGSVPLPLPRRLALAFRVLQALLNQQGWETVQQKMGGNRSAGSKDVIQILGFWKMHPGRLTWFTWE